MVQRLFASFVGLAVVARQKHVAVAEGDIVELQGAPMGSQRPPSGASWSGHPMYYLSEFATGYDGGGKIMSLTAAKSACVQNSNCGGITCSNGRCTLRKGKTLKDSHYGEISYLRTMTFPSLPANVGYSEKRNQRYEQYATGHGGGKTPLTFKDAQRACAADTSCRGISCEPYMSHGCTTRAGSLVSSPGWYSYEKRMFGFPR